VGGGKLSYRTVRLRTSTGTIVRRYTHSTLFRLDLDVTVGRRRGTRIVHD